MIDLSQFHAIFFEEAAEHLAAMESLLLDIDVEAPDDDELNAIFRAAHSIKGASATFGFNDMAEVTHYLETLLDKLRNHELALEAEMIDAFLQAGDILKQQLQGHRRGEPLEAEDAADVMQRLNRLAVKHQNVVGLAIHTGPSVQGDPIRYRISFLRRPAALEAESLQALLQELASLGSMELPEPASPDGAPSLPEQLSLTTDKGQDAIYEVLGFLFENDDFRIGEEGGEGFGFFEPIPLAQADPGYGFFEDLPPATGGGAASDTAYGLFESAPTAVSPAKPEADFGLFEPQPAATPSAPPAPPIAETPAGRKERKERKERDSDKHQAVAETSIRVSVDKVDHLINLVGELVITQAMLAQSGAQLDAAYNEALHERLQNGLTQLERNTRDLQEAVMSIRMMPISFVFSRFPRMVRDLAAKLNKEVELVMIGESTELDRGLIEKIVDPLTHLVRNSVDHGIESPAKREAAGKDRVGTLTLRAAHQGGNILIEVVDNGGGLNREKILAKAQERGLEASDAMSDQEVWQLIFAPGFSTADAITDISGRGVGMDVVKKNIDALGGRVEIASEPGYGTTISIRLPLTLAILDGMLVGVGRETYILPLAYVLESLQPKPDEIKTMAGRGRVIQIRGEYLPLIPLYSLFDLQADHTDPSQGIVVVVDADGTRAALLVDDLLGQQQVVIKSLEANYRKVPGMAGATILGDGRVALILDLAAIGKMAQLSAA